MHRNIHRVYAVPHAGHLRNYVLRFVLLWFVTVLVPIGMMTSSNGIIFRITGLLCGEFTGPRRLPRTKASKASFHVFFDLRLNKRLSKQSWGCWFETLSRPLWRHCDGITHILQWYLTGICVFIRYAQVSVTQRWRIAKISEFNALSAVIITKAIQSWNMPMCIFCGIYCVYICKLTGVFVPRPAIRAYIATLRKFQSISKL